MVYDVILGFILLVGFVNGFKNGLAAEVAGLFSLLAAVFVAFRYYTPLMSFFNNETLAIMITFIVVYFALSLVLGKLVEGALDIPHNIGNQLVAGLVGLVEMAIFLGVVMYGTYDTSIVQAFLENGSIAKYIEAYTFPLIKLLIPIGGEAV